MIQSWAKLQLKLLFYGAPEIAATRHNGTENRPLQLKEQRCVFLALFMSFENLSSVLNQNGSQRARAGDQGSAF